MLVVAAPASLVHTTVQVWFVAYVTLVSVPQNSWEETALTVAEPSATDEWTRAAATFAANGAAFVVPVGSSRMANSACAETASAAQTRRETVFFMLLSCLSGWGVVGLLAFRRLSQPLVLVQAGNRLDTGPRKRVLGAGKRFQLHTAQIRKGLRPFFHRTYDRTPFRQ